MDFEYSDKVKALQKRLHRVHGRIHLSQREDLLSDRSKQGDRWQPTAIIEELKPKARAAGLWNLFLPENPYGAGLTNLEYAPLCEIMGRSHDGARSVQLLGAGHRQHGSAGALRQRRAEGALAEAAARRRDPLVLCDDRARRSRRRTRPTFEASIVRDGDDYVINGRKWWSSGAGDPRCKIAIFMGKTDPTAPRHKQQSMILVPMDAPGVTIKRMLTVFGYDHAPHGHGEVAVRKRARAGVEHAARRRPRLRDRAGAAGAGPHSSLHAIDRRGGARAGDDVQARAIARRVRQAASPSRARFAPTSPTSRIEIEQARLLTLKAAYMMDTVGNKAARAEIAMIKVVAPNMALRVIDRAIQACGGGGVCQDFELAAAWAGARTLRLADGPDEVHREAIAKLELKKYE